MSYAYELPDEVRVEIDGPVRIVRLNRPDDLNAVDHALHRGLALVWGQLDEDPDARVAVVTGNGRAFSAGGDFGYLDELTEMPSCVARRSSTGGRSSTAWSVAASRSSPP